MARAGRPRKQRREPSGRVQRETVEEIKSVAVEARERVLGVPKEHAGKEEAGSIIGQLYVGALHTKEDGRPFVNRDQYDAAIWYLVKRNDYLCAITSPAAVYDRAGLSSGDEEAHENFVKEATKKWYEINAPFDRGHRYALEIFLVEDKFDAKYLGNLLIALNVLHRMRVGPGKRSLVA